MGSRSAAALLGILIASVGCAGVGPGFEPPEVYLIGLEPLPGQPMEQRFAVTLRVLNPNDSELHIDGVDFTLDVNGSRLTRGVSNQQLRVPRLGEASLRLVATTSVLELLRQVVNLSEARELGYELRGRFFLANSPLRLDFERKGSFGDPIR